MRLKKITISVAILLFTFSLPVFASDNPIHGAGEDSGGEYFEDNGSFNERSEEESRDLEKIIESIHAESEEASPTTDETGRVIFICKNDKVNCECIRVVAYNENDMRYEFDLTKALSYSIAEIVPAGRYNVINAYDENGNDFFVLDDHFIVSNGKTTSVSVFRSEETESEAKHIEPLPEEESTAEEISDVSEGLITDWFMPVSVLIAAAFSIWILWKI